MWANVNLLTPKLKGSAEAAYLRCRFKDLDFHTLFGQLIGATEAGGTGTDDQDFLSHALLIGILKIIQ